MILRHFYDKNICLVKNHYRRRNCCQSPYPASLFTWWPQYMMENNGNNVRVTCPLWRESTGVIPSQRPVTRNFDVFFVLRLNKRLGKQSRCWWFDTPSRSLWRQCDGFCVVVNAKMVFLWWQIMCFPSVKISYHGNWSGSPNINSDETPLADNSHWLMFMMLFGFLAVIKL